MKDGSNGPAKAPHHPALETLLAYREGRLPAAEAEDLRDHLVDCESCSEQLLELRDFLADAERGADLGPASERQAARRELDRRLRATPLQKPSAPEPEIALPAPLPTASRLQVAFWALAAGLLVTLGLATALGVTALRNQTRLEALQADLASSREETAQALDALRQVDRRLTSIQAAAGDPGEPVEPGIGTEARFDRVEEQIQALTASVGELDRAIRSGGGSAPPRRAASNAELSFRPRLAVRSGTETPAAVPGEPLRVERSAGSALFSWRVDLEPFAEYENLIFQLLDESGAEIWRGRQSVTGLLGDAGTQISASGVPAGRYRLQLRPAADDGDRLLAELPLLLVGD